MVRPVLRVALLITLVVLAVSACGGGHYFTRLAPRTAAKLGRGILRGLPAFKMLVLLVALFPTSDYFYNAAFALLQRRVGEDQQPTRRPLRRRIKAEICLHRNVL
jgi:uncharacterized membrane protein